MTIIFMHLLTNIRYSSSRRACLGFIKKVPDFHYVSWLLSSVLCRTLSNRHQAPKMVPDSIGLSSSSTDSCIPLFDVQ